MESTLQLKRADFAARTGDFLGFGFGEEQGDVAWDTFQAKDIYNLIDNGLRQFYWPPVKDGQEAYEWSFLKPVATLTVPSGESTFLLPADFGGFEGPLVVSDSAGSAGFWAQVPIVDPQLVLARQNTQGSSTGRPVMAAEEWVKGTTHNRSQRKQLRVWPTPDQEYTAKAQYYLIPDALTAMNPYCYGGPQHAETIEASILAAAELKKDKEIGEFNAYWLQRLAASISLDRKHKPQLMGRNVDRSDDGWGWRNRRPDRYYGVTTVYGVEYALLLSLSLAVASRLV